VIADRRWVLGESPQASPVTLRGYRPPRQGAICSPAMGSRPRPWKRTYCPCPA